MKNITYLLVGLLLGIGAGYGIFKMQSAPKAAEAGAKAAGGPALATPVTIPFVPSNTMFRQVLNSHDNKYYGYLLHFSDTDESIVSIDSFADGQKTSVDSVDIDSFNISLYDGEKGVVGVDLKTIHFDTFELKVNGDLHSVNGIIKGTDINTGPKEFDIADVYWVAVGTGDAPTVVFGVVNLEDAALTKGGHGWQKKAGRKPKKVKARL